MAREEKTEKNFKLKVPLDATAIEDITAGQSVKVVVQDRKGALYSQEVKFDAKRKTVATIIFPDNPGSLKVMVGPAKASVEEITGLQTISVNVSAHLWKSNRILEITSIKIAPYYWYWWLHWCRTFTIRGRVLCPDGNPVPGAEVCAHDVDWWWWWSSNQQVGCATTDATGAFKITFKWCCGWWPWWWWKNRVWQLEPDLVGHIMPVLQSDERLPNIPTPSPKPDRDVFEQLLGSDEVTTILKTPAISPEVLPSLRDQLSKRLPVAPELERLRIWPWYPWYPWWDCTPDIIFKVKQNCQGEEMVIVDETFSDARWNIPTTLDVTLIANSNACCTGQPDDPEGDCLVLDSVCDDLIVNIGGNPPSAVGVAAVTDGFLNPGFISTKGDRPYAANIPIHGSFGDSASANYYEFEWSDDDGLTWNSMPIAAAGDFTRKYHGPHLDTGIVGWHRQDFKFEVIDGHNVIESRQHFEITNGWGTSQSWWTQTLDLLMVWKTANLFADGRYRLRVRSWTLVGSSLTNPRILPLCNTQNDNGIVVTIDNRVETPGSFDVNGHPCGSGTVHTCTSEPDTGFLDVRLLHDDGTESEIASCGNLTIKDSDILQIDFVANDPDGHLAKYTLQTTYGDSLANNLLTLGGTLSPSPVPVSYAPAAAQVGPTYANARSVVPGAVAPIWHGGVIRLQVPAKLAFPETCCYQLELRAHKRTIVGCNDSLWGHTNYSEYSFMIVV